MTAQIPEPITAPTEAPLTFQALPAAAPGAPNPIPRAIPWNAPITPETHADPASPTEAQA